MKEMLSKSIGLAEQVIKSAKAATSCKEECNEIISKTQKLAELFHKIVNQTSSQSFYERPARIIVDDTEQVLENTLSFVVKCSGKGLMKHLAIIPAADLRKTSSLLETSIENVTWLFSECLTYSDSYTKYFLLPPIAKKNPVKGYIWNWIAILYTGSLDARSDAARGLDSLVRDNNRNAKLIIKEEGVQPLLRLVEEGKMVGQKYAAKVIGLLSCDQKSVEYMIHAGVCDVFEKVLKQGHMKVQAMVAWAVSELVANYPSCQDIFSQYGVVRLLIKHLAFEIDQEPIENIFTVNKATSVLAIVMARNNLNTSKAIKELEEEKPDHEQNLSLSGKERDETKDNMKVMAARALCNLVKGNSSICHYVTGSRALTCFVFLLEKGSKDVQYYSAMALMEITAVAEEDSELRRSTFRYSSPVCKIVIDRLVNIIERKEDSVILIPCIKAVGNLAKTFRVAETRIIALLIQLLDDQTSVEICTEVLIVLTKFVCKQNYLHLENSKAIIEEGGAQNLAQVVFFGEHRVKVIALYLLCQIALCVPDSEGLKKAEVLRALQWASNQSVLSHDEILVSLVPEAISRLESSYI